MQTHYDKSFDPRAENEKARADLKRNTEQGLAPQESLDQLIPSVTPATFGEHSSTADGTPPVDREERDDPLPNVP